MCHVRCMAEKSYMDDLLNECQRHSLRSVIPSKYLFVDFTWTAIRGRGMLIVKKDITESCGISIENTYIAYVQHW